MQVLIKKFMKHALQESPENLGLTKLFRNLGGKIGSTTLGTGFCNVRPDQSEESVTSHHGTALSNGSNVVTTKPSRGARAWVMSITLRIRSISTTPPPWSICEKHKRPPSHYARNNSSTAVRSLSVAKALNADKVGPDMTSPPRMYTIETRFAERA